MSNQAVGGVYQAIIDEVINSSRVDFEESGIEESVLEELRKGWQQKLTQLDVARFPWDPKPDPPPPAQPAATGPAVPDHAQSQFVPAVSAAQGLSLPHVPQQGLQNQNGVKPESGFVKQEPGAPIKQEPGAQGQMSPYQAYGGNMDNNKNNVAAHRAAQQLQAQYGQRAASSINALHQQQQQPQGHQQPPQQQQQQIQQPQQQQPQQGQPMAQQQQQMYRQQMANATAQQMGPGSQQHNMQNGQTDGAGDEDFEGVLMQRSAAGTLHELGRVDIDHMLHARIAANAKNMEGGGLMLPLEEATRQKTSSRARSKGKGVAGFDGGDDDEEVDEDAINSDLDDSDEDKDDDEVDDEGLGHIMLCMYDKVQRVKNKWKCTLKDGVLTVNGKEYVFHKATGEYEW